MKHPFKIIGLLIIVAAAIYAMWPDHTVKDHNPKTGEGAPGEEHLHEHLDAPTLNEIEESIETAPLEKTPVE